VGALLALPATAAAHALSATFESRLPLAVYVAGAAAAVGLSFVFVLWRDVRAAALADDGRRVEPGAPLRLGLRAVGLLGWAWIAAQAVLGGESDAEVARLFAWVYGWVGVAMLVAFVGPAWHWLDPFATLHDLGAGLLRRLGVTGWPAAEYPAGLGRWPAVIGFAAVVWLELVASGAGSRTLGLVILGYTVYTLAMMAQFGRDTWRATGEIFSVWFSLLGRLAPRAVGPDGRLRRRGWFDGLREGGWTRADIVLVALGTGSILFDGLSQTKVWVDTFGLPAAGPQTLLLTAFLGIVVAVALGVSRLVGVSATAAGLLPIAVGYLVAHYLTYLLIEGQRIVIALSDPFQQGWDLFGTAFYEVSAAWLPPALVWTAQLAAVVGGHMVGAWAGHVIASGEAESSAGGGPGSGVEAATAPAAVRLRQVPLAILMVGLTTLTLWSLGQVLFVPVEG
jgi:hypothetical protein